MPAVPAAELVEAVDDAIAASGNSGFLVSSARRQPRIFLVTDANPSYAITLYLWTLTFGGRPSLADEYRIQKTGVKSPLAYGGGPTVMMGYEPQTRMFAGFDFERHRVFTTGSPSAQIDWNALIEARREGLSFYRKSNDEIAIGIRPDLFLAYVLNAPSLHRFGTDAVTMELLSRATREPLPEDQIQNLPQERRRVVAEISRLSRDAAFKNRVRTAYNNRCAVTGMQLRLIEAAHILPVGTPGSVDAVQNGIALSPTYHRAYDAGLIYLDEQYVMRLNVRALSTLRRSELAGGEELFRQPLGEILLPNDRRQYPSADFIRRANRVRGISR